MLLLNLAEQQRQQQQILQEAGGASVHQPSSFLYVKETNHQETHM
jgi:hypothetical protein